MLDLINRLKGTALFYLLDLAICVNVNNYSNVVFRNSVTTLWEFFVSEY